MCKGQNLGSTDKSQLASSWALLLKKWSKGIAGLGKGQAATRKCWVKKEQVQEKTTFPIHTLPPWLPLGPIWPQGREAELLVQVLVPLETSTWTVHANIY